jgi:hypothetical protein
MLTLSKEREISPRPLDLDAIPRGRKPDPLSLYGLYFHFGKNVDAVATFLDVTRTYIYVTMKEYGFDQVLPLRGRRHLPVTHESPPIAVSDHGLLQQYVQAHYSWRAAADGLGVSNARVFLRLAKAIGNGESVVRCFIEVQRRMVKTGTLTDHHVAAVVIAHNYDVKGASHYLGIPAEEVRIRAQRSPFITVILNGGLPRNGGLQ